MSPLPVTAASRTRPQPAKTQPAAGGMPAIQVTVVASLIAAALLAAGWFTRRRRLAAAGQHPPTQPPAS